MPTFPLTAEVVDAVSTLSGTVAARAPVVAVMSGPAGDDHGDLPVTGPGITVIHPPGPEQSLAWQAAILGRAATVVGTYGGMTQLALRMRVPAISVWAAFGGTAHAHLQLSLWLGQQLGVPFLVGRLGELPLWRDVLVPPLPRSQPLAGVAC